MVTIFFPYFWTITSPKNVTLILVKPVLATLNDPYNILARSFFLYCSLFPYYWFIFTVPLIPLDLALTWWNREEAEGFTLTYPTDLCKIVANFYLKESSFIKILYLYTKNSSLKHSLQIFCGNKNQLCPGTEYQFLKHRVFYQN